MQHAITRLVSLAAALAAYLAAVIWLTWPLALQASTHLPSTVGTCLFDTPLIGWILSHETHALTTAPWNLPNGNQYHPAPYALFYGPTAFGALPLFAPVFLASGNPTLAVNVTLLGGAALTALALHAVLEWATGSRLAAVVGAFTFLTTRWLFWDLVPTNPFYACLAPFPLIVAVAAMPVVRIAWLLPLVVLQCLTDPAYVAAAVLAPLSAIALARLVRPATRAAGMRTLAAVVFAPAAMLPIYACYARVAALNPDLADQTNWRATGSMQFPWLGQHLTKLPWGPFGQMSPVAVAPLALGLAAVGIMVAVGRGHASDASRHLMWHAAAWTMIGLVISLTPAIEWDGRVVRLPHAWLVDWRPLRAIREPDRLAIGALVGVALLAGLAFERCVSGLPRPARAAIAAAVLGGIYAQYALGFRAPFVRAALPTRYPTSAVEEAPGLVALLRRDEGPVLELPVGPLGNGTAPIMHVPALYRSIQHWRPLLNGYDGYWPAGFRERMALAMRLPDADALAALRAEAGLATIVVHEELMRQLDPPAHAAWAALAASGGRDGLRLIARDGDALVFRVGDVPR